MIDVFTFIKFNDCCLRGLPVIGKHRGIINVKVADCRGNVLMGLNLQLLYSEYCVLLPDHHLLEYSIMVFTEDCCCNIKT